MDRKCHSCTVATKSRFTGVFAVCVRARGGSVCPGGAQGSAGVAAAGNIPAHKLDVFN